MDKDSMRNKLERLSEDIRKKAVTMEQAITDSERRSIAEENKTKTGISDRYEAVINSDKIIVRAALAIKSYDDSQLNRKKNLLTLEQQNRLADSLQSEEAKSVLRQVSEIYHGSVEYGKFLISLRSQWQKAVGIASEKLAQWTAVDATAEGMTKALVILCAAQPDRKEEYITCLKESFESSLSEGQYKIFMVYDDKEFRFKADIETGGLYEAIINNMKGAEYQLRMLKGAVEPYLEFLYKEIEFADGETSLPLWFIPQIVESLLEYPDAVSFGCSDNNRIYFRYHLLAKKMNGETITPDEEKRAVIPDYNQVTEDANQRNNCVSKLTRIFKDLYTVDGKQGKK